MTPPRLLSIGAIRAIHGGLLALAVGAAAAGLAGDIPAALVIAGAIVAGEVAVFLILQRRAGAIIRRMVDATALTDQGQHAGAGALLDELAGRARLIPNLHALILHHRAGLHLACGELEAAEVVARSVEASGWLARQRSGLFALYPALCAHLAVVAALRDDPDEAARWRARAHATVSVARRGTLVFMDAVLLARAGELAAAHTAILDVGAAGVVPAHQARVLRWVLAYAASADPAAPLRAPDLAKTIAAARPHTREALALGAHWPALAGFVRAQLAVAP
jgi:hypothetical protein